MSVKIIGVCLPSRSENFLIHMEKRKVSATIINAVTTVHDERVQSFSKYTKYNKSNKNNLCTLSHLLALKQIADSEYDYGVILEDDVNLHTEFNFMLTELIESGQIKEHEIISIGYLFSKKASLQAIKPVPHKINDNLNIGKNAWKTLGTQGYVCTRAYALRTIQAAMKKIFKNTEEAVFFCSILCKSNARIITYPPLAVERFDLFGSTLGHASYNKSVFCNITHILKDYE
jgi:GR25 family glycosyltransferase involved in LPS biosynthesis